MQKQMSNKPTNRSDEYTPFTYLNIARELEIWRSKQELKANTDDLVMKYIGKLSDPSSYTVYSNYVLLEAAVSHGLLTTTLLPTLIQGLSSAQYPSYIVRLVRKLIIDHFQRTSYQHDKVVSGSCFIKIVKVRPALWLEVVDEIKHMFQEVPIQKYGVLIRFLAPFLNCLMMDYLDVPFECHNLVYCTVVSHLRQWLVESTVSSVEGAKCGLSVVQTCVHIAKNSSLQKLLLLCTLSRQYLCLSLNIPVNFSSVYMRSCSLDLLLSYLCAMTESGEIVDTQLQLLLADSSSDRILEVLKTRHLLCISWMLCKCLLLPDTVQILLALVSKWLQGNRASQSLWKHILFLPLLHIVSFPKEQAGLLGPVFKQNLQVAGSLLSNLVDISDSPHCSISSEAFASCIASPPYEELCSASHLLNCFHLSGGLQIKWMEKLIEQCDIRYSEVLALTMATCLIGMIGSSNSALCFDAVTSIAQASPAVAHLFIPVLFYCVQKETSSIGRFAILKCLSKLAVLQKSCLSQIVTFLVDLSSQVKLLPTVIRLLSNIWIVHDSAVYQHLFKLLSFPLPQGLSGPSTQELALSRVVTIVEMCEARAEIHGEELVGIVLQNFQKQAFIQHLTPDGYALICKLSLDALKILCNREVTNPLVLWKSVVTHLTDDARPLIVSGVCSFIEIFTRHQWKYECDILPCSAFKFLWNCALSQNGRVCSVAWSTLNAFDIDVIKLCHVPQEVSLLMGINEICGVDTDYAVNVQHILSVLPHIPHDSYSEYFVTVQKYLTFECENVPRGTISTAIEQAQRCNNTKVLEDYLRTIQANLPTPVLAGTVLLVHNIFDPSLQRPQLKKFVQSSKSSFIKLLKEDLTPSDLMMKEINALYVMRIPYDWKVFCDNMVEGLLQMALLSNKGLKDDQLMQTKQLILQDLMQVIIESHRQNALRSENVLHALVALASSPQLKESSTAHSWGSIETCDDANFRTEILLILSQLLRPSAGYKLAAWSNTILKEILRREPIEPMCIACDCAFLITILHNEDGGLQGILEIEDVLHTIVDSLVSYVLQRAVSDKTQCLLLGLILNKIFVLSWGILPKVLQVFDRCKEELSSHCNPILSCFIPILALNGGSRDELVRLYDGTFKDWEQNKTSWDNMVWCTILSEAFLVLTKHRILSDLHLRQLIAALSTVPLAQQNSGVYFIFGHLLQASSALGYAMNDHNFNMIIKLWISGLQQASTSTCCYMGLMGAFCVRYPLTSNICEKACVSWNFDMSNIIPSLFQTWTNHIQSADPGICGSLLYLLVSLLVGLRSTATKAIPQDLSYLKKDSGLQKMFSILQEERLKNVVPLKVEYILSAFENLSKSLPPVNWSPILACFMRNGTCTVQENCLKGALKGQLMGSKPFVVQFLSCFNLTKYPTPLIVIICQNLDFVAECLPTSQYCQLLYALVQVFEMESSGIKIAILQGLLNALEIDNSKEHWMCKMHISVVQSILRIIHVNSEIEAGVLKKVAQYVCAVRDDIILNFLQQQDGKKTLLDVALLSESMAVTSRNILDWNTIRKTIMCILYIEFDSPQVQFLALLYLATCIRELLQTTSEINNLLDTLNSVADSLNSDQRKVSLQIVVFCLSPVTVLSLSCLLDKLLAHPSELQPLLDIHLSYLLQPPIGVPACEDIHAVLQYCLETCSAGYKPTTEVLNVVSAITQRSSTVSTAMIKLLTEYFME